MADFYSSEDRTYTKDFQRLINSGNQIGIIQGLEINSGFDYDLPFPLDPMYIYISSGRALFENRYIQAGDKYLQITAANPVLDRKDLVYLTSAGSLSIATGIAASIPKPPNIGGPKRMILAEIYITAGTTEVLDSDITDERVFVYGNKYKDIYEGAIGDSGLCEIFDDEDDPIEDNWIQKFNPMTQWGG